MGDDDATMEETAERVRHYSKRVAKEVNWPQMIIELLLILLAFYCGTAYEEAAAQNKCNRFISDNYYNTEVTFCLSECGLLENTYDPNFDISLMLNQSIEENKARSET